MLRAVLLSSLCLSGCDFAQPSVSTPKFDSNYGSLYVGTLRGGTVVTDSDSATAINGAIHMQFRYLLGYLDNTIAVTPQAELFDIRNQVTVFEPASGLFRTTFDASTDVVVPSELADRPAVSATVPLRADSSGIAEFDAKFQARCGGSSPLWYYYAPLNENCELSRPTLPPEALRVELELSLSPKNSSGKSPEYDKIWADGLFEVTTVHGNIDSFVADDSVVRSMTRHFEALYGAPTARERTDHTEWVEHLIEFNTPKGVLRIHSLDLARTNVRSGNAAFDAAFSRYSKVSDFVGYNGHAGLGANIEALQRLSTFERGRYAVYFINACHPWSYLQPFFFDKISRANRGEAWSKYVDVMTTTANSYLAYGRDFSSVISRMIQEESTYESLLLSLEQDSSFFAGVVIGEEDNG